MKKITSILILMTAIIEIQAQDYEISFAGSGASTTVDYVKVQNLTQCTETTLKGSEILNLTLTVGIDNLNMYEGNAINIYPNPMSENCSIDFEATAQGRATIGLYNINGKRILQVQKLLSKGHHAFSLSGLTSGVYFLRIESDNYSYTSKLVSENVITSSVAEIKDIEQIQGTEKQNTENSENDNEERKLLSEMLYTTGDMLKFTGFSEGIYSTSFMLVPDISQTVSFNFVDCTDADSNHYTIVQIGEQIWMAENLKTTRYQNDVVIPDITENTQWGDVLTGARCYYENDSTENSQIYGTLYNWLAITSDSNIAPQGWHVASAAEWKILYENLGGEHLAGGILKENCSQLWNNPNMGATNEIGFTALPGGYRYIDGTFDSKGYYCYWWTSTGDSFSPDGARFCALGYNSTYVSSPGENKLVGYSVRCIKD